MTRCHASDCAKPARVRGLCQGHYYRLLRYGTPYGGRCRDGEPMQFLLSLLGVRQEECIFWPYARGDGYGQVRYQGRMDRPNRVICKLAHGAAPDKASQAAHRCGNGGLGCVNPKHLYWASPQENTEDKVRHGTIPRGESAPWAKLTASDVAEIRSLAGKMSQQKIGERYGVDQRHVSKILNRKAWA